MLRKRTSAFFAAAILLFFANLCFGQSSFQETSIYRIAAGTRIPVKLEVELNSRSASKNDTFISYTASPVMINDVVALPEGTLIEGLVLASKPATFGGRDGQLDLTFRSLKLALGVERSIEAMPITKTGEKDTKLIPLVTIAGSTVGGYLIGNASDRGEKRWLGAGIGAAIGAGLSVFRKGNDASIKGDQIIELILQKDVILPVYDH